MVDFQKAFFCIDSIVNEVFEGYSLGDNWNGFECPYFEKPIAERVLEESVQNSFVWSYDEHRDAYVVQRLEDSPTYEPEEFEGQWIKFEGRKIKVYGIGAYSWIWGLCDER